MSDTPRTNKEMSEFKFGENGLVRASFARQLERELAEAYERCAVIAETAPDLLQNSTFDGVAAAIRALKS